MPFYYSVFAQDTTDGTADTLATHFRFLTVASGSVARIVGLYGAGRDGTAGGGQLDLIRPGAAGSGGTAQTPADRNPDSPAADLTAFDDTTAITAGTSPITHVTVGWAQTGGMGGWVALEPDHALALLSGGGANGNAEIASLADGTSQNIAITGEFFE